MSKQVLNCFIESVVVQYTYPEPQQAMRTYLVILQLLGRLVTWHAVLFQLICNIIPILFHVNSMAGMPLEAYQMALDQQELGLPTTKGGEPSSNVIHSRSMLCKHQCSSCSSLSLCQMHAVPIPALLYCDVLLMKQLRNRSGLKEIKKACMFVDLSLQSIIQWQFNKNLISMFYHLVRFCLQIIGLKIILKTLNGDWPDSDTTNQIQLSLSFSDIS